MHLVFRRTYSLRLSLCGVLFIACPHGGAHELQRRAAPLPQKPKEPQQRFGRAVRTDPQQSHRSLEEIASIGVDEVQWKRGHKYQTLVYQIDEGSKRLLWIGPDLRRMSWKEVAECFGASWDHVYDAVKHAVSWGLTHRSLEEIASIGLTFKSRDGYR